MDTSQSDITKRVYCCIHCGSEVPELYHSYSPTVLKISECTKCNRSADEYVECDVTLVLLDLFLQKLPAYRHVLCNTALKNAWRLLLIFVLCDAYYNWVESRAAVDERKMADIYDLEWHFYLNILQASIEALTTITVIAPFCLYFGKQHGLLRSIVASDQMTSQDFLRAIVNKLQVGFYGNVLVLLAVVWEQHQSTSFMILTRIFLCASHVQVFRALSNASCPQAASVIGIATCIGKLARLAAVRLMSERLIRFI